MKKKILILVGVLVVVGAAIGVVVIDPFSADVVQKERSTENLEKPEEIETSSPEVTIASIAPLSGEFSVETDSSEVFFINGVGKGTSGVFRKFSAKIVGDGTPEGTTIQATIDPSSIFTDNEMRDDHLKGSDFFNVANFPDVSFESSKVVLGDTGYYAEGTMSFLGVEQEVKIPFKYAGKGTFSTGRHYHVIEGQFVFATASHKMVSGQIGKEVTVSFYLTMVEMKS